MPAKWTTCLRFCFPKPALFWKYIALILAYTLFVLWTDDQYFPRQKYLEADNIMATTSVVIGLLLVFRTNSAYDRWWEGRKLWGQLVNDIRNLSVKTATFLELDSLDSQYFGRLLIAFPYVLKHHLRSENVDLKTVGLEPVGPGTHLPFHVCRLIFERIALWRKEAKLDGFAFIALDSHAKALMDICGACERIRSSPIAASYKAIIWIWLSLYLCLVPWLLVPIFDLGALVLILIGAYFVLALELLAEEVEDPFGTSPNDLALDTICQKIESSVKEMLSVSDSIN